MQLMWGWIDKRMTGMEIVQFCVQQKKIIILLILDF